MRVLITGAGGFIGARLLDRLADGHEVFALARRTAGGREAPGRRWIEQDLSLPLDYSRLPPKVDAVIHLAQSRLYRQFPEGAEDVFGVNVGGTFRMLEYARRAGAERFVFASTGGVYGYGREKFSETDAVRPLNFYLSSKYAAELLLENYKRFFGAVVFRLFFVYGPGQRGMLVPTLVDRVVRGETVVVEGARGLKVNPIYVDDAVSAFEAALRLPGSALVNVAGDEAVTISELVGLIERAAGRPATVEHSAVEPEGDLVADNSLMKELLGVYPRTGLAEGLGRMCRGGD